MIKYKNLGGESGIDSYEIKEDSITVRFLDGAEYLYSLKAPGKEKLQKLKTLANSGKGLNSYISSVIKKDFEQKLKNKR